MEEVLRPVLITHDQTEWKGLKWLVVYISSCFFLGGFLDDSIFECNPM